MPRLIIIILPIKIVMIITVVIPSMALPIILSISAQTPKTQVTISITMPRMVTICIGAVENDEIFEIAYFKRPLVDHFDCPSIR